MNDCTRPHCSRVIARGTVCALDADSSRRIMRVHAQCVTHGHTTAYRALSAVVFIAISVLFMTVLCACTDENTPEAVASTSATLVNVPGRAFSSLSMHPNNKELLFVESRPGTPGFPKLLRYQLQTGKLHYYDLPANYAYPSAAFSPRGNYIVMQRIPSVQGDYETRRQANAASELVIMRSDGTELKVLPLMGGLKMRPVMSHDERHIAYWRAAQMLRPERIFAYKYDVWEVDLMTGTDQPFAGVHEFIYGEQLQYFPDNTTILVSAQSPMTELNIPFSTRATLLLLFGILSEDHLDATKKYEGAFIYRLTRGDTELPEPIVSGIQEPSQPSLDAEQHLYFTSFDYRKYTVYKQSADQSLRMWEHPWSTIGEIYEVVASQDGNSMPFIFVYLGGTRSDRGIGLLDLQHETWTQLDIPTFEEATPIDIQASTH